MFSLYLQTTQEKYHVINVKTATKSVVKYKRYGSTYTHMYTTHVAQWLKYHACDHEVMSSNSDHCTTDVKLLLTQAIQNSNNLSPKLLKIFLQLHQNPLHNTCWVTVNGSVYKKYKHVCFLSVYMFYKHIDRQKRKLFYIYVKFINIGQIII